MKDLQYDTLVRDESSYQGEEPCYYKFIDVKNYNEICLKLKLNYMMVLINLHMAKILILLYIIKLSCH
jgi:hypothetical protein